MKKNPYWLISGVFAIFVVITIAGIAYSKSISYLPRSEELQQLSTPVSYSHAPLIAIDCAATGNLTHQISRCQQCLALKTQCPDCCLSANFTAKHCSAAEDPKYGCAINNVSCLKAPFTSPTCPAVASCQVNATSDCAIPGVPGCQKLGCSNGKPDISGAQCIEDPLIPGTWICNQNKNNPRVAPGCAMQAGTAQDCSQLSPSGLYTVTPLASCPANLTGACFSYTPELTVTNCILTCKAYADAWETYDKNTSCCREATCCGVNPCAVDDVGYTKYCTDSACTQRLSWPECQGADRSLCCNDLTPDICDDWSNQLATCMSGAGGACKTCFVEMDSSFHFDLVAKSNEKLAIIWQVDATPSYTPVASAEPSTYFYTMVKVFEEGKALPVHESIVHQRSFIASFSIFSATVVDKGILSAGKKYTIRLYYYMPTIAGYTLESDVKQMQLIIWRIRE